MRRRGASNIRMAFTAGKFSHFGGIYLLHRFFQSLQLRTFLSRRFAYIQKNNKYSTTEMILALIYPMILGLEKIEVSALLKTNGVFQYLTGIPSFPNPTTLRRFLLRSAPDLAPSLCEIHNSLRKYFMTQPSFLPSYCIDFDSTANTLYGHQEGVVKGYNPGHIGKKSYHPLVATEAHLKDALGGFLRYGNAHTAEGVIPLLRDTIKLLPYPHHLRTRADSGFYEKEFVKELDTAGIGFTIVARMTAPIKRRLSGLRYHKVNAKFSTAEFFYQPHSWEKKYRFVVLRRKIETQPDQELTLFTLDKYAYSVIVTNLPLTPYGIFTFYKDRANLERIIRILKNDFPFGSAPTKNFVANAFYAELSLLAHNLITWFKRLCLPDHWQSLTLPKLRHQLFMVPGELVHTNNVPTLKFPKNSPNKNVFVFAINKIKKLVPLA
ncbi:MAG: IS1380 family transposase [Chlamydiae bacterium]|nr:IS1380 family transposase [Chlamydiota bacterium]MBI3266137.1 IS1380 family transposase [Chlamydiota bacterium]